MYPSLVSSDEVLPKKSDILFKICDRKFNGELTVDILERFLKEGADAVIEGIETQIKAIEQAGEQDATPLKNLLSQIRGNVEKINEEVFNVAGTTSTFRGDEEAIGRVNEMLKELNKLLGDVGISSNFNLFTINGP